MKTYSEQLEDAWKKAKKRKDAEAMVYYERKQDTVACVAFSASYITGPSTMVFKGSAAYDGWKSQNAEAIAECERRFTHWF